MGVIYKITCKTTQKSYIGQTKYTAEYRWAQHVKSIWRDGGCVKLISAIIKYKPSDFTIETIHECDDNALNYWETFYIKLHDTLHNGYNLSMGGGQAWTVSLETRQRMSEAGKGKAKNPSQLRELPKYMIFRKRKNNEGYQINNTHPNLHKFPELILSYISMKMSMDEKFSKAMEALNVLNSVPIDQSEHLQLPIGFRKIGNGYKIQVQGHPCRSWITKALTMEEKYKLAKEYYDSIQNK